MIEIELKDFDKYHDTLINSKEIIFARNNLDKPLICYFDGCDFNEIERM